MNIPEHSDEALQDLINGGLGIYDYANYLDESKKKIIAYQRWGSGFRKDIVELLEDKEDG